MIPVDLDRLREALGNDPEVAPSAIYLGHKATEEDHRLVLDTARTVQDAPTVWWCDYRRAERCSGPKDPKVSLRTAHARCGWVALVPVKGGQE